MNNNILEKITLKVIAATLIVFMSIALICSLIEAPHIKMLNNSKLYVLGLEVIGVFFLGAIIKLIYTIVQKIKKEHYFIFSALCLIIITIGQILVIKYLEIRPIEDLNKVTNMAINLVNGQKFTSDNTYFSMYTNNIPFAIYLSKYFKICIGFGINNYTLAGSLLGIFSINTSIIFTSLILKELKSNTSAILLIALNVINPLVYLWGTFFYTTIIALPFMMFGIFLIIKLFKEEKIIYFSVYVLLLTIVVYIGTQIRATTCFILIGAIIVLLLKTPLLKKDCFIAKKNILKIICGIMVSILCLFILTTIYNKMNKDCMQADYTETQFPATHWIMMGLEENGGYNWIDEQATLSRPTQQEKVDFNKERIVTRINELGIIGLTQLVIKKIDYTWSDGTHDYPVIMRACHNYTNIHKYIIGEKSDAVILAFQIFHIMTLLLAIIQMIILLKRKNTSRSILIYIVLLGGFLFHIIWEANPKYSLNFLMLLLYINSETIEDIFSRQVFSDKFENLIYHFSGIAIISTIILAVLIHPIFTKHNVSYSDTVQEQLVSSKDRISDIYGDSFFYQSFNTKRSFNNITIQVDNQTPYSNARYTAEILDDNQTLIHSIDFSPKHQNQTETIELNFPKVIPSKPTTYYLKISAESVKPENAILFCMHSKKGYDVFPHGNLSINNKEIDGDLTFTVNEKIEGYYTNISSYIKFFCLIIFIEISIYLYYYFRNDKNFNFKDIFSFN